jgi:hypothetical protein
LDPFIEVSDLWGDFHFRLIATISDAISAALPNNFVVRLGKRRYIEFLVSAEQAERYLSTTTKIIVPRGGRVIPGPVLDSGQTPETEPGN